MTSEVVESTTAFAALICNHRVGRYVKFSERFNQHHQDTYLGWFTLLDA